MVLEPATASRNRVHNEIHNFRSLVEALPSQVFQVVTKLIKGQKAGKGAYLVLDHTTKGTLEISPKGTVPIGRGQGRTLFAWGFVSANWRWYGGSQGGARRIAITPLSALNCLWSTTMHQSDSSHWNSALVITGPDNKWSSNYSSDILLQFRKAQVYHDSDSLHNSRPCWWSFVGPEGAPAR